MPAHILTASIWAFYKNISVYKNNSAFAQFVNAMTTGQCPKLFFGWWL
jgi:hypothetical protein